MQLGKATESPVAGYCSDCRRQPGSTTGLSTIVPSYSRLQTPGFDQWGEMMVQLGVFRKSSTNSQIFEAITIDSREFQEERSDLPCR